MDACFKHEQEFTTKTSQCQNFWNNNQHNAIDLIFLYLNSTLNKIKYIFEYIFENKLLFSLSVVMVLVLLFLLRVYWRPFVIKKELTDIAFDHIPSGPHKKATISRALATRKMGSQIPPPYPNGWFAVVESGDLKIGSVIPVDALGHNLCVYRGEDGVARCVDAYCPHLGANLAIGGIVYGNCIECPFHSWRFDEHGACVSVPQVQAPKGVSLKTWCTAEADGAVWIWHDAENREPLWEMSDAPELKYMKLRGTYEVLASVHIQDIFENGADIAHFDTVHANWMTTLREKYPYLANILVRNIWSSKWSTGEDYTSNMDVTMGLEVLKMKLDPVIYTSIVSYGPGHGRVFLRTFAGLIMIVHSVTPIAPLLQRFTFRIYAPWYNAPLAAILLKLTAYQLVYDVKIWNWKRFEPAPAYTREDKAIRTYRNWYSQFYSKNSVTFKESMQNSLNW